MTQPPNDPTDLYGVIAGINPSMSPEALYGRLNGQILLLDDMQTKGQSVNPNYRARVALARDVLGTAGPKQQYDAARASGGRPTDDELVAMVGTRASMRATHKQSTWKSPGMIVGYAIFGVIAVVLVLVLATSCGDDGEPAATRGTASTAAGATSTGSGDGKPYTLDDMRDGRATWKTVRTIELGDVNPIGATFTGANDTATNGWQGSQSKIIAMPDGTVALLWQRHTPTDALDPHWLQLRIDGDDVTVVDQSANATTVMGPGGKVIGKAATGIEGEQIGAGVTAVTTTDGRIFGFADTRPGKLFELKGVAK